jgi:hypothetical protein
MGKQIGRRTLHKLSAREVEAAKAPGYVGDGGGLWLQISPSGTKSWVFRYARAGRAREMGLGPLHTISLLRAREKARDAREQLLEGKDPIEARQAERRTADADSARAVTFQAEAEAYIEAHRTGWKNAKHAEQWVHPRDIRLPAHRKAPGERDRHGAGHALPAADLVDEDGDGFTRARPDRGGARLRDGAQAPHRRQPGALAGSP